MMGALTWSFFCVNLIQLFQIGSYYVFDLYSSALVSSCKMCKTGDYWCLIIK